MQIHLLGKHLVFEREHRFPNDPRTFRFIDTESDFNDLRCSTVYNIQVVQISSRRVQRSIEKQSFTYESSVIEFFYCTKNFEWKRSHCRSIAPGTFCNWMRPNFRSDGFKNKVTTFLHKRWVTNLRGFLFLARNPMQKMFSPPKHECVEPSFLTLFLSNSAGPRQVGRPPHCFRVWVRCVCVSLCVHMF